MSTSIVTAPVLIPSADVDVRAMTRIELGRHGEDVAAAHLDALGWTLLERNHRIARGEIDIIALDGETLVFVEVKARRTLLTGLPQAAVDPRKVRRLRHLVGYYLLDNAPPHRDVRIDVAAVLFADDGTARLELLRAVGA